jgi:SOS response regulatory protein OraA/RecX
LKNIQCDVRFTEEFIRSRLKKNKGPRLISSELSVRGISDSLINNKLCEISDEIWQTCAFNALEKKLKGTPSEINPEKIYSFLIGRGFDHKMIKCALDEYKDEC